MRFSPKGKYTYWYQDQDSSWYTRSTADGKEYRLTTPQTFAAWDEDNDVPDYPSPYGIAGWTDDDQSILIKDRYDIWKFDPIAASSPVNLTVNGRKEPTIQAKHNISPDLTKEPKVPDIILPASTSRLPRKHCLPVISNWRPWPKQRMPMP